MRLTFDQIRILQQPVAILRLPSRVTNALENAGVLTIRDLLDCCPKHAACCTCPAKHLLSISNFGGKTLEQVFVQLEEFGFVRQGKNIC